MRKARVVKENVASYTAYTRPVRSSLSKSFRLRDATPAQIKLVRRNVRLYEKYAKRLEKEHKGEFVAIGLDGALIVGTSLPDVLQKAAEQFGAGNFALWKIGYDYVLKWRRL